MSQPPVRPAAGAFASWLPRRGRFLRRVEDFLTRLSAKNGFWQKVCSMVWLPYAFYSGIRMKRLDSRSFMAVLPFRRFNRNWYNAMAGAALLGNSEIAGGMYLLNRCGGDYVIVCKKMEYRFLRPCLGPAVYDIIEADGLDQKLASGEAFNIQLELGVRQFCKAKARRKDKARGKGNGRELRVGRCEITFHCRPRAPLERRAAQEKA